MLASKKDTKSDFFEVPEEDTIDSKEALLDGTAEENYKLEDSEVSNFRKKKGELKETGSEDILEPTVLKPRSAVRHLRAEETSDDIEDEAEPEELEAPVRSSRSETTSLGLV